LKKSGFPFLRNDGITHLQTFYEFVFIWKLPLPPTGEGGVREMIMKWSEISTLYHPHPNPPPSRGRG
jgi:hypothetical protein